MVVDGADRLRDGADVEIPNPDRQDRRAVRLGADDAARAARRAQAAAALNKACSEDVKKLCPTAQPGSREMRMCLFQNRDDLSDGLLQGLLADAPGLVAAAADAVGAAAVAAP